MLKNGFVFLFFFTLRLLQILLLGISSSPWDCDQKSLAATYNKIIVIPRPDYASLYHIWNDLLFQYSGVSRKFNVSMLAKLSSGYSVGTIVKVLQEVRIFSEDNFQLWNRKKIFSYSVGYTITMVHYAFTIDFTISRLATQLFIRKHVI